MLHRCPYSLDAALLKESTSETDLNNEDTSSTVKSVCHSGMQKLSKAIGPPMSLMAFWTRFVFDGGVDATSSLNVDHCSNAEPGVLITFCTAVVKVTR